MKRTLILLVVAILAVSLFAGCGNAAAPSEPIEGDSRTDTAAAGLEPATQPEGAAPKEAEYVIKFSHELMESTPQHTGALAFKELLEDKSGGRIRVDVFPSGQLGSDTEVIGLLQSGAIEMALTPTARISGSYAPLQVLDLPYLFPSREVLYSVVDDQEFKDMMFKPMETLDVVGLSIWESGFKQFTANKALHTPEDFKGLKFRTMESPLIISQFKALGAVPTPIDFAETYNALQQGVVDGQENPLASITSMRFYEVQSHLMRSNHAYLAYVLLIQKNFFEQLPADLQQAVMDAANEAAAIERQTNAENEAGYIQTIQDSGTEVIELTAEETNAFVEAMMPVHEEFRDVIGSDLLDKTYSLIEQYKQ